MGPIATEFLAQAQGHRILQVGAADLDDRGKGLGLYGQSGAQRLHGGQQGALQLNRHGHMQGRGEGVVAGLAEVHMIVGVHRALAAQHPTGGFDRPIGDHLVDVHVGLGAGARLPHLEREFSVEAAGGHLLGSRHDQGGQLRSELALGHIHLGAGCLERSEGVQHRQGHGLAEGEIFD